MRHRIIHKKLMFSIIFFLLAIFQVIKITSPYNAGVIMAEASESKVKINKKKITLAIDKKITVQLQRANTKRKIMWSSSNNKVAVVKKRSKGKATIIAKKAGKAVITARYGGNKYNVKVTVRNPSLNKKTITLNVGKKTTLQLKNIAAFKKVTWSSGDNNIALVKKGKNGKATIFAKKKGVTKITAFYNGKKYKCNITVRASSNSNKPTTKNITVKGVTFDLSNFPLEVEVGKHMECLSVKPLTTIDPEDITYKIADGNAQLLCDDSVSNLTEKSQFPDIYVVGKYYVSEWKNRIAYINASYEPNMYLQYRVEIYSQLKPGSFPVSVYYKGNLIRTCKVNVTTTGNVAVQNQNFYERVLKRAAWTDDMTIVDKLNAICEVIRQDYTYEEARCNEGALAVLYAARDLGLKAWYDFEDTGNVQFFQDGSASNGGHVRTMVEINGKILMFEAQGH